MPTTPSLTQLIDFQAFGVALLAAVGGVVAVYISFKGIVVAFKWGMRRISGLISKA